MNELVTIFDVQLVHHSVVVAYIITDILVRGGRYLRKYRHLARLEDRVYHILCVAVVALHIVGVAPAVVRAVSYANKMYGTSAEPLVDMLLAVLTGDTAYAAVLLCREEAAVDLIHIRSETGAVGIDHTSCGY